MATSILGGLEDAAFLRGLQQHLGH
ncbi:rCG26664, isoform CRA_b [Rattus norvegicus]|uniref:RCG26664, isoform CRA_b n=1 Tax=Rattus norvegicus TaxID=10116 RepID=A6HM85_RAT|nr:rCG26664, isoform CRA_b [Rattus norvegicus]